LIFEGNVLSVELEPWHCFYDKANAQDHEDRGHTVTTTTMLLDLFEQFKVRTTFFVEGTIYELFPRLVEEVVRRGHEIAFHGSIHTHQNRAELRNDFGRARRLLERFKPRGFRAPKIDITPDELRPLHPHGFEYDSSVYAPFNASLVAWGVIEIPVSTYPPRRVELSFPRTLQDSLRSLELPFGSGLFVGLLPAATLSSFIDELNRGGQPAVMCVHPWQLAPFPRLPMGITEMILKTAYTKRVDVDKLRCLLRRHSFTTMASLAEDIKTHGFANICSNQKA
jgi:peptidoglycan/xylan/chitin deacetylase (PgdA/CDA1 family)